jgi:NAD(P)-dependent dehydrogenase (short-subunit alcohol dehydrogenase family)
LAHCSSAQAFVPFLQKSDAPRIVNVSSGGGQLTDGADGWAPTYCISKTALNGVTVQLAAALRNFAVNSVCPGWFAPTWAAPARPDQSRKVPRESSGSPPRRRKINPASSFAIGK